jgi:DNA-binding LytR/AlgR family response regulator
VDAFAVEAVDYLLKPFDFDRFQQAFERASRAIRAPEVEAARLVRLLEGLRRDEAPLARLLVRSGESLIFVKVTDVQALAAADKLVEVLTDRKVGTVRETLSSLEEQLPRDRFVRVHRSWLVNLDAVAEVTPWAHGDYVIRLRSGRTVPLSRRYAANVLPG